jgi:redox-sensitive bicupin YhaK (pirin superfamily)
VLAGRFVEGHVVAVAADGKAKFRDEVGANTEVRVPRHVDQHWLAAAVALAPVPAIALHPDDIPSPVLWCVFSARAHQPLDERFQVHAKTVELSASESIRISTGKSVITVTAKGEVSVRGKNITSRASNLNRIRGGAVKIN